MSHVANICGLARKNRKETPVRDLPLGQTESMDPGDHGVPNGALVSLYAFVVWGSDNEANQMYTYAQGNTVVASYAISGTTLSYALALLSVA